MNYYFNPKHGKLLEQQEVAVGDIAFIADLNNYKDLGWQLHFDNNAIVKQIHDQKLKVREYDNSLYCNRGTDIVYICDVLQVYWHIDMSD